MKLALALILFLITSEVSAQAETCLPSGPTKEIVKDFSLEEWRPSTNQWTQASIDSCSSQSFSDDILRALIELKNLPPLAPLKGTWASNIIGSSPYVFLKERVKIIRIDTNPQSSQCAGDNNTVLAFAGDSKDGAIHLCPLSQTSSRLTLMTTLLHEARHLMSAKEIANSAAGAPLERHSHVFCKRGLLAQEFACDESYSKGGSYAVGVEFLLKLSRTETVPTPLRLLAHEDVISYAGTHFNLFPGGTRTGALLVNARGSLDFFDSESRELVPLLSNISKSAIITLRLAPTLFDIESGTVFSYFRDNQVSVTDGSFATAFRDTFSNEKRRNLRDVYYGGKYACFLFSKQLHCESGDTDAVTIDLPPNFTAVQFAAIHEPMNGLDIVHIVSSSGDLYMLPVSLPLAGWSLQDLTPTPTFKNFKGVGILPGLVRIAVTTDGTVVSYDDPTDLKTIPELSIYRFHKMIAPYYWTPSLSEL